MTNKVTIINVRGIFIEVWLLSPDNYKKDSLLDNSMAAVIWDKHKVVFNTEHLDLLTVRHEICHLYIKSCFSERLPDLNVEQLEEIAVETFAYFGTEIIKISDSIYKQLLEIKEKHSGKVKNRTRKKLKSRVSEERSDNS